jgi:hypothetical protein
LRSHRLFRIVRTHSEENPSIDMLPSFLTDENADGMPDSLFNGLGELIYELVVAGNNSSPTPISPLQFVVITGNHTLEKILISRSNWS